LEKLKKESAKNLKFDLVKLNIQKFEIWIEIVFGLKNKIKAENEGFDLSTLLWLLINAVIVVGYMKKKSSEKFDRKNGIRIRIRIRNEIDWKGCSAK